jgi:hypothetical protein
MKRQEEEQQLGRAEPVDEPKPEVETESEETIDEKFQPGEVEAPNFEETDDKPDKAEQEEETELIYGRTLNRRRPVKPDSNDKPDGPVSDEADLPKPVDKYSAEDMSFGRQRRKKTR